MIYKILAKFSPLIILVFLLVFCIVSLFYNPNYDSVFDPYYLIIMFTLIIFTNYIAKYLIFKPIYKLYKYYYNHDDYDDDYDLPILGIGYRPKLCNDDSFGMPSCHSQIAFAFATYIICLIVMKNKNSYRHNIVSCVISYVESFIVLCIALCIALYISYSRVYIEKCHTIQQVIIGSIFGIICGIIMFYYE